MKIIRMSLLAGILLAGIVLVPVLSAQSDFVSEFETTACPFELPEGVTDGEDVTCGFVTVPELHANPGGATIRIAVAIAHSLSDDAVPDPLVMEEGGPGGSTLANLAPPFLTSDLALFRENRDLIFIEQRGTLFSEPNLLCPEVLELGLSTTLQGLQDGDAHAACHDRLTSAGINLSAYNSVENAADVAMIVTALGYDTFNFFGISYGTVLGQHLMRDFPDRLRSVALDSVLPLETNFIVEMATTADRSYSLFFDSCAADTVCNEIFPDLEAIFFDVVAQLNEHPGQVSIEDPATGEVIDLTVTGDFLVDFGFQSLYIQELLPQLPDYIYRLADGDPAWIEEFGPNILIEDTFSDGMFNSVMCTEDSDFKTSDLPTQGIRPQIVNAIGTASSDFLAICEVWDVDALGADVDAPVVSDIPTLVMNGEFDPVTPPIYGTAVGETLSNAYVYEFAGASHGAVNTECALLILLQFVDNPAQEPDAACLNDIGLRFTDPDTAITLTLVSLPDFGISTVIPEGWDEIEPGTFARGTADNPTALFIVAATEGNDPSAVTQALIDAPELLAEFEVAGLLWPIYLGTADGSPAFVAATTSDDEVYFIILLAPEAEIEAMTDTILFPAIEAFAIEE